KKILMNPKGNHKRTTRAFLREVVNHPLDIRQHIMFPRRWGNHEKLDALGIMEDVAQADSACLKNIFLRGGSVFFPRAAATKKSWCRSARRLESCIRVWKTSKLFRFYGVGRKSLSCVRKNTVRRFMPRR